MKRLAHDFQASKPRRGFTLIEVLVVVAIIALLVSILLPALSRAREQTRTTVCLSGLKQLGLAVNMYTNDTKGVLPGPIFPGIYRYTDDWLKLDAPDKHWYRSMLPALLRRYMQANRASAVDSVGTCPTSERLLPLTALDTSTAAFAQRRPMMYIANTFEALVNTSGQNSINPVDYPSTGTDPAYYFGRMNTGDSYATGAFPVEGTNANQRYRPKKIDRVQKPTREWMIADAWWWQINGINGTRAAGPWFQIFSQIFSQSSVYDTAQKRWYVPNYPFHLASKPYPSWTTTPPVPDTWKSQRLQDGKTNEVFFDGHAESVRGFKGSVNPCMVDRGC